MTLEQIQAGVVRALHSAYDSTMGKPLEQTFENLLTISLNELGIDSATMLAFLVAVEDEFGIEWSDDVDQEMLRSVTTIARFVNDELAYN